MRQTATAPAFPRRAASATSAPVPATASRLPTPCLLYTSFGGTLEFFPEEGKYHLDGHRGCGVCLTPAETLARGGLCPVCGKKLTIGVEHRVEALADRPAGFRPANAKPFESLAPLPLSLIHISPGR